SLRAGGVDVGAVLTGTQPTGVAFIQVDGAGQNSIVVSPGANAEVTPSDVAGLGLRGAAVVMLQLEVPLETVLAAARAGRAAGAGRRGRAARPGRGGAAPHGRRARGRGDAGRRRGRLGRARRRGGPAAGLRGRGGRHGGGGRRRGGRAGGGSGRRRARPGRGRP